MDRPGEYQSGVHTFTTVEEVKDLARMRLATAFVVVLCAVFLPRDPLADRVALIGAAVLTIGNSFSCGSLECSTIKLRAGSTW